MENIRRPKRGPGARDLRCQQYEECLSEAAEKDWKSFNCQSCPLFTKAPPEEKKENTRVCECGRPTIHPNSPYCGRCLAEKSKQARLNKKSTPPTMKTPPEQPQPSRPGPKPGKVITIDFQAYPEVLASLERVAHNEVRPLEAQILFVIKVYVEKVQAA